MRWLPLKLYPSSTSSTGVSSEALREYLRLSPKTRRKYRVAAAGRLQSLETKPTSCTTSRIFVQFQATKMPKPPRKILPAPPQPLTTSDNQGLDQNAKLLKRSRIKTRVACNACRARKTAVSPPVPFPQHVVLPTYAGTNSSALGVFSVTVDALPVQDVSTSQSCAFTIAPARMSKASSQIMLLSWSDC
jgi:hypothetical protein